jgi:hypothetical protein
MRIRSQMIREGTPERETATKLATRFNVTAQQIRKVVKKQLKDQGSAIEQVG